MLSNFILFKGHTGPLPSFQIKIKTEINEPDPQAGIKSEQVIDIDFASEEVKVSFTTGTTELLGQKLESARNNFKLESYSFSDAFFTMKVSGETASGVLFIPNINYSFTIVLKNDGSGSIEGCHDGYPSYYVSLGDKTIYHNKHQSLEIIKLLGSCDIELSSRKFSI